MISGIYQILNLTDCKRYIGSACNLKKREYEHLNRLKNNRHYNTHLQRSYNKYGKENFKFEVLLFCDKENLIFYEQRAINSYDFNNELYNFCPKAGNTSGRKFTEETKRKIGKANKGRLNGEKNYFYGKSVKDVLMGKHGEEIGEKKWKEQNIRLSNSRKGKKRSEETRKKISEALKGEKHPMYGKKHSEESIEKNRLSNTGEKNGMYGRSVYDVWVKKYGKEIADEKQKKANIKKSLKSPKQPIKAFIYTTRELVGEFESIKECCEKLNVNYYSVSETLRKKQNQTRGYTFEYINKKEIA